MQPLTYDFLGTGHNRFGNYIYQDFFGRILSNVYHSHDFYEVILVCRGVCTHVINEHEYAHKADDLIFLRPGDYHSFTSQSANVRLLSLSVEKSEFETICAAYDKQLLKTLSAAKNPPIISSPGIFSWLLSMPGTQNEYDCKFTLSYLLKVYIDRFCAEEHDLPKSLEIALKEMSNPENIKIGIPKMVELSGYSRVHLSRLIKKHRGVTIHDYVLTLRLDHAYQLLILSSLPIDEISESVGFSSLSHFYKVFRERFGQTPFSLRKDAWEETKPIIF